MELSGVKFWSGKKSYNTCSTPRLHSIEYTVSCILWSGILDRSFGFLYSMEWNFGVEFLSGVLEWSRVKFWSGKNDITIPDFCLLPYSDLKIKDNYIYNHKCKSRLVFYQYFQRFFFNLLYILNHHKILALLCPVARELTNIVELYLTINSDFLQLRKSFTKSMILIYMF